jgi:hypothetical protein
MQRRDRSIEPSDSRCSIRSIDPSGGIGAPFLWVCGVELDSIRSVIQGNRSRSGRPVGVYLQHDAAARALRLRKKRRSRTSACSPHHNRTRRSTPRLSRAAQCLTQPACHRYTHLSGPLLSFSTSFCVFLFPSAVLSICTMRTSSLRRGRVKSVRTRSVSTPGPFDRSIDRAAGGPQGVRMGGR